MSTRPISGAEQNGSGPRLTTWKEIASFFGKTVRTVQRWEANMKLPVHRPVKDRNVVIAFADELEQWAMTSSDAKDQIAELLTQLRELSSQHPDLRKQIATQCTALAESLNNSENN